MFFLLFQKGGKGTFRWTGLTDIPRSHNNNCLTVSHCNEFVVCSCTTNRGAAASAVSVSRVLRSSFVLVCPRCVVFCLVLLLSVPCRFRFVFPFWLYCKLPLL